jgi:putative transposase
LPVAKEGVNVPNRKSPRLPGYDYTQTGVYFVTLCTFHREYIFGRITNSEMALNELGQIAYNCWQAIPSHFPQVSLDLFVVMPNHIHGLIAIDTPVAGTRHASSLLPSSNASLSRPKGVASGSLGAVVGSYKSAVTRAISIPHIWQGRYHDHIVRSEPSLNAIREYILYNPARWERDYYFK